MAAKSAKPARPAKRAGGGTASYTKPALRVSLKEQIQAGDKGGRKGQWSARKAQLLAREYEKQGGGYRGGKGEGQKHLDQWSAEHWQTEAGGARARHGRETERYLPKKAWEALSPAERQGTNAKKRAGSRSGKQFVANTPEAKAAGSRARGKSAGKAAATRKATPARPKGTVKG